MKKLANLISFILLLFMVVVSVVMADTISIGDYVRLIAYNSVDNAGTMTYQVSHNGGNTVAFTYDTFCIQENVNVYPDTWYPVAAVSGNVGYFSPSSPPAGAGPLNGAVDYLFYQYKTGGYSTLFNGLNGKEEQADFQRVLWSLQGSGPSYASLLPGTPWDINSTTSDLYQYTNNSSMQHAWGTEVINIVTGYSSGQFTGPDIQNQLYNPVPEPSALLLLGFGLVGIVGIRRKLKN